MFYQTCSKFKMKTPEQSSIHLSKFEKDNGKIKTFFFQLNNIEPKVTPDEFALVSLCCTFHLSTLNMIYQVTSMLPLTKYRCYNALLLTWNIILQVTLVLTFDVFSFTINVTKLAATKQTAIEMNMTITNVLGFLEALFVCIKIQNIDENKTLTLMPLRQLFHSYKNDLYDCTNDSY